MKRLITPLVIAMFAAGALALVGCESSNPTTAPSGDQNAYAGGNGIFGEDPANPGEHSRQRFVDAAQLSQSR